MSTPEDSTTATTTHAPSPPKGEVNQLQTTASGVIKNFLLNPSDVQRYGLGKLLGYLSNEQLAGLMDVVFSNFDQALAASSDLSIGPTATSLIIDAARGMQEAMSCWKDGQYSLADVAHTTIVKGKISQGLRGYDAYPDDIKPDVNSSLQAHLLGEAVGYSPVSGDMVAVAFKKMAETSGQNMVSVITPHLGWINSTIEKWPSVIEPQLTKNGISYKQPGENWEQRFESAMRDLGFNRVFTRTPGSLDRAEEKMGFVPIAPLVSATAAPVAK